jgi:hypothetical protein
MTGFKKITGNKQTSLLGRTPHRLYRYSIVNEGSITPYSSNRPSDFT